MPSSYPDSCILLKRNQIHRVGRGSKAAARVDKIKPVTRRVNNQQPVLSVPCRLPDGTDAPDRRRLAAGDWRCRHAHMRDAGLLQSL
jgi:hypothetical protein